MEPLCCLAGGHLVESALDHDNWHVEAWHGANQVCGGKLGQQRGLRGAHPANGAYNVSGRVVRRADQAAEQSTEPAVEVRVGRYASEVERQAGPGGELLEVCVRGRADGIKLPDRASVAA